ncbi:MAG: hypothetical protein U0871_01450 [Gemmataceae bacterium]
MFTIADGLQKVRGGPHHDALIDLKHATLLAQTSPTVYEVDVLGHASWEELYRYFNGRFLMVTGHFNVNYERASQSAVWITEQEARRFASIVADITPEGAAFIGLEDLRTPPPESMAPSLSTSEPRVDKPSGLTDLELVPAEDADPAVVITSSAAEPLHSSTRDTTNSESVTPAHGTATSAESGGSWSDDELVDWLKSAKCVKAFFLKLARLGKSPGKLSTFVESIGECSKSRAHHVPKELKDRGLIEGSTTTNDLRLTELGVRIRDLLCSGGDMLQHAL